MRLTKSKLRLTVLDGIPSEDGHDMVIGAVNVMPLKCLMKGGPLMLVFLSQIYDSFGGPCTVFFILVRAHGRVCRHRKRNILVHTSESIRSFVLLNLRLLDLSRLSNAFNTR